MKQHSPSSALTEPQLVAKFSATGFHSQPEIYRPHINMFDIKLNSTPIQAHVLY